jgi:HAMP domain-containing protein
MVDAKSRAIIKTTMPIMNDRIGYLENRLKYSKG